METKSNYINPSNNGSKKRVLFVITQSEAGGAQRFIYNLTKNLTKDKYELLIVAGQKNSTNQEYSLLEELNKLGLNTSTIEHLQRDINLAEDIKAIKDLKQIIKSFRPNILFLNSSKAGVIGSIASRLTPAKFRPKTIYRIGGWSFNDPWPSWKKTLWIIIERITAHWKDIIIVNNHRDLKQAQQLKIRPRQKLELIYNGIDPLKVDFKSREDARLELFKKARIPDQNIGSAFLVGTIANFYPPKGLSHLIQAINNIKHNLSLIKNLNQNIKFIIIGDGEMRQKLETQINIQNLQNFVFLVGQISDAYKYLSAFDLFVLPSLKEGFPWAVLEAMSTRLPVIATSVGALPEIIESGKNGILVAPGNSQELSQTIIKVTNDDKLRQELGIQGHQTILFKFGLDKMTKAIEALF